MEVLLSSNAEVIGADRDQGRIPGNIPAVPLSAVFHRRSSPLLVNQDKRRNVQAMQAHLRCNSNSCNRVPGVSEFIPMDFGSPEAGQTRRVSLIAEVRSRDESKCREADVDSKGALCQRQADRRVADAQGAGRLELLALPT